LYIFLCIVHNKYYRRDFLPRCSAYVFEYVFGRSLRVEFGNGECFFETLRQKTNTRTIIQFSFSRCLHITLKCTCHNWKQQTFRKRSLLFNSENSSQLPLLSTSQNENNNESNFVITMGRPPIGRSVDSRTRLLNSLGMFQQQCQQRDEGRYLGRGLKSDGRDCIPSTSDVMSSRKTIPRHVRSHSDIPVRSALRNTTAFETKLNDESMIRRRENRSNRQRRLSFSDKDNSPGSVRFNTVVSGLSIPSRNQYSRRIKQTLWRDRYELSEMVERNTTEFHAENYDWNQVVLDDEMYVDATSGERVHPCHVEDYNDSDDTEDDHLYDDSGFSPLARAESVVGRSSFP